jgi:hypothetical protein
MSVAPISEFCGHRLTDDPDAVEIGFHQPDGQETVLRLPRKVLHETILGLIGAATALVPPAPIGLLPNAALVLGADRGDLFKEPGGDWCLRFRLLTGDVIGISMDPSMATIMAQALKVDVLGERVAAKGPRTRLV